MKELSIKEKAKAYDEAKIRISKAYNDNRCTIGFMNEIFPELRENWNERIRTKLIEFFSGYNTDEEWWGSITEKDILAWLEKQGEPTDIPADAVLDSNKDGLIADTIRNKREKQGEQKLSMIQWKGNNLKKVVNFTGVYKEGFEKWFHNSWEEYEKYVHEHNNIFKLFNEDGSHYEVPVGAWIVKTPDGYNVASKAVLVRKPAEWSEDDEKMLQNILECLRNGWKKLPTDILKYESWLKSLRPQNTWKPSEEQIRVVARLRHCLLEDVRGNDVVILDNLLEQLKAL